MVVFVVCLGPRPGSCGEGFIRILTADPIKYITHFTGDWILRFLVITLAITPLRKILHVPQLIRFRRMFGLFAFLLRVSALFDVDRGWIKHLIGPACGRT